MAGVGGLQGWRANLEVNSIGIISMSVNQQSKTRNASSSSSSAVSSFLLFLRFAQTFTPAAITIFLTFFGCHDFHHPFLRTGQAIMELVRVGLEAI